MSGGVVQPGLPARPVRLRSPHAGTFPSVLHASPLQGFQAQGNEFSYFMLLASAYLLNGVEREEQARVRRAGWAASAARWFGAKAHPT